MEPNAKRISYTLDQYCEATGLNRNQAYRAIAEGDLRTFKMGRRRMVSAEAGREFIAMLEARSQGAQVAA